MSEFLFLTTRVHHPPHVLDKAELIASRHDCTLVWVGRNGIPGNPLTGWFAGPDLGYPFDRDLAARVSADLHAAGINWKGEEAER